ncbi:1658_t:CDS:2, partial [Entrophospora sp. SA101]
NISKGVGAGAKKAAQILEDWQSVIGQATGRPMCYFCYNTSGLKSCTVTTEEFSGSLSTDYAVLLLTSQEPIKNGSVSW